MLLFSPLESGAYNDITSPMRKWVLRKESKEFVGEQTERKRTRRSTIFYFLLKIIN